MPNATLKHLTYAELHADPNNLRVDVGNVDELADSIAENGLLQAITARKNGDGYVIIAGHRRHAAIGQLVKDRARKEYTADTVWPVLVRNDIDEAHTSVAHIVENLHRAGLTPIEELQGFLRLMNEHGWSVPEIAKATAIPESTVKARIKLAGLPDHVLAAVATNRMRLQDAGKLAGLNAAAQARLTKGTKVPSSWDIDNAVNSAAREAERARLIKQIAKAGHVVVTDKEFDKARKNGSEQRDVAEWLAKLQTAFESADADNDIVSVELDAKYVSTNKTTLQEYLDKQTAGELFTITGTGYVSIYHQKIVVRRDSDDQIVGDDDDDDEVETQYDRDVIAARAELAKLTAEYEQARLDAIAQYLQTTKPAVLLAGLVAEVVDRWDYQIKRDAEKITKLCGLERMDGTQLLAFANKSVQNAGRVVTAAKFTGGYGAELPGWDREKPKVEFPHWDDYDEDGNKLDPELLAKREAAIEEHGYTCACGEPMTVGRDHGLDECPPNGDADGYTDADVTDSEELVAEYDD